MSTQLKNDADCTELPKRGDVQFLNYINQLVSANPDK